MSPQRPRRTSVPCAQVRGCAITGTNLQDHCHVIVLFASLVKVVAVCTVSCPSHGSCGSRLYARSTNGRFYSNNQWSPDGQHCFCAGEKGVGKSGKPLHFKGSKFHRVIPNFMCQVTAAWLATDTFALTRYAVIPIPATTHSLVHELC